MWNQPAQAITLAEIGAGFHGALGFIVHEAGSPGVYLAAAGVLTAWFLYLRRPDIPGMLQRRFGRLYAVLVNKYYFVWFNENVIAVGASGGRSAHSMSGSRGRRGGSEAAQLA